MAALRCSACDIYFPLGTKWEQCPACGAETWKVQDEAHEVNWQAQVDEILRGREPLPKELEWDYEQYPVLTEFEYRELEKRRGKR